MEGIVARVLDASWDHGVDIVDGYLTMGSLIIFIGLIKCVYEPYNCVHDLHHACLQSLRCWPNCQCQNRDNCHSCTFGSCHGKGIDKPNHSFSSSCTNCVKNHAIDDGSHFHNHIQLS